MAENSTSGRSETSRAVLDAIAKLESFENMEIHVRLKAEAVSLTGTASESFKEAAGIATKDIVGDGVNIINNIVIPPPGPDGLVGECDEDQKECYCNGNISCVPISRPCPDCDGGD